MSFKFDPYPDHFQEIARMRRQGRRIVQVTVIGVEGSTPRKTGAKMLVLDDGTIRGTVGGGIRESDIIAEARTLLKDGGCKRLSVDFREGLKGGTGPVCGGQMEVFMECIEGKKRVVISGAGHIGYFLHRFLTLLDFQTVIIDPRTEFNTAERFEGADLLIQPFAKDLEELNLSASDSLVLVGPTHEDDEATLPNALRTKVGYLGMIGSKRKVKTVLEQMRSVGFTDDDLARIHAPVGLDIGSETPAEIALSIAAEIVKHFAG